MRFKRVSIHYVGEDGLIVKENSFATYKEAQRRADKLHRSVLFKKSEVEVMSKVDWQSPSWATHIAYNSDNIRYDVRIEKENLIRIEKSEDKFK